MGIVIADQPLHDELPIRVGCTFFDSGLDFAHRMREESPNEIKLSHAVEDEASKHKDRT